VNGQQQCIEGEESVACVWRKRVGGGRDEERDDSSAEVWGRGAFPAPATRDRQVPASEELACSSTR
jgi:hypothetical protein